MLPRSKTKVTEHIVSVLNVCKVLECKGLEGTHVLLVNVFCSLMCAERLLGRTLPDPYGWALYEMG